MKERWKPINGLDGLYEVSDQGRVRSIRSGKILKPRVLPNGYERVHLPTARDAYIHRIVADAFCDHKPGCDVVNHIDNNPRNNRADNIEWTTQRGNVHYAMKQGRVANFPNAKAVVGTKDGTEYRFGSQHEAALFAGCDSKTISRACRFGKVTRNGFTWKVVESA